MRLSVMAGIMLADELAEAKRRIERLELDVEGLKADRTDATARDVALQARLTQVVSDAATRLDRLADALHRPTA
jgi:cell division protein ZapA